MYHVNPETGEFDICHAKSPENCPFGVENHSESYEEIQIKADIINKNFFPIKDEDNVVTFSVAECGEFKDSGEYIENIANIDDAIKTFKKLPNFNSVPSINIRVPDINNPKEHIEMNVGNGEFDLFMVSRIPSIMRNPKTCKKIAELIHAFPNAKTYSVPKEIKKELDLLKEAEK